MFPSSWSSPAGPGAGDSRARESTEGHLTQSFVALWVWTTNQETWTGWILNGEKTEMPTGRKLGREAFGHWKYREAMNRYLLASVTFPDTRPRV